MRGAPCFSILKRQLFGITPAYAGSTYCRPLINQTALDHPRVCGEHPFTSRPFACRFGSPPRMRGALVPDSCPVALIGITPAYAGSTMHHHSVQGHSWDHPRVCGEHAMVPVVAEVAGGSPPRMRGAPVRGSRSCRSSRDHPRVCGEHSAYMTISANVLGSPPRMRGARLSALPSVPYPGITPAYAGSTKVTKSTITRNWDHPRVCGEHCKPSTNIYMNEGSPPRMRGALTDMMPDQFCCGITPAYAGSTGAWKTDSGWIRDHPRVCGEHPALPAFRTRYSGSPPRMRGALTDNTAVWTLYGITPAYAGSTAPIYAA